MAKPLAPAIKNAIVDDYGKDKPHPNKTDIWCEQKAVEYQCDPAQVKRYLAGKMELMEARIAIASQPIAQKLATVIGATQAKAIAVLDAAMSARKIRLVRVVGAAKGEPQTQEVTEPDWDIRVSASEKILKIYGAYAPQQIEVRHGLTEELKGLSDEEIKLRVAAANQRLLEANQSSVPN